MHTEVLEENGLTMATTQVPKPASSPLMQQRAQQLTQELTQELVDLSDQCNVHLSEVERDLTQTTLLLSEAIEKLGASFMGIHAAVSAQQREVERLLAGQPLAPELAGRIKKMQDELGTHIGAAVTGLQFQDMTNQLIDRSLRRVAGVKHVLSAALPEEQTISAQPDRDQLDSLLCGVRKALEEQGAKLEAVASKSVAQTHMQSGDVELF